MNEIKVLDHGFVKLRNLAGPTRRESLRVSDAPTSGAYWEVSNLLPGGVERSFDADDTDPANAARMSFDQMDSGRTYAEEMKLNKYLLANEHFSPFEMIVCWFEMKVPIFIDRQFVRHGTIRRNESSGRYITLPAEWYIPEVVGGKAANKKQGQEDNLDPGLQEWLKMKLNDHCKEGYAKYLAAIDLGVAPEHARIFLGLGHYVHYLAKVDLRNLFNFLRLREHSHAQIEAQKYAGAIVQLLDPHLPGLMGLYKELIRK